MQELWREGHVTGFISRQAAENALLDKPSGTFLLRFSDSELGGVTIAFVRKPYANVPANVSMVEPFTIQHFSQWSLVDAIFDIAELTHLYPNTNKEVFKKFCTLTQHRVHWEPIFLHH